MEWELLIIQGEGVLRRGVKEVWVSDRPGSPLEALGTCWIIVNSEELRVWQEGEHCGKGGDRGTRSAS